MDRSHSLIATKAITYGGRSLSIGDRFSASRRDANALKALKRATDAPATDVPSPHTYSTRDVVPASAPTPSSDHPASKRRYRRRDLTPEP